jgi:hypothetical protein
MSGNIDMISKCGNYKYISRMLTIPNVKFIVDKVKIEKKIIKKKDIIKNVK